MCFGDKVENVRSIPREFKSVETEKGLRYGYQCQLSSMNSSGLYTVLYEVVFALIIPLGKAY